MLIETSFTIGSCPVGSWCSSAESCRLHIHLSIPGNSEWYKLVNLQRYNKLLVLITRTFLTIACLMLTLPRSTMHPASGKTENLECKHHTHHITLTLITLINFLVTPPNASTSFSENNPSNPKSLRPPMECSEDPVLST